MCKNQITLIYPFQDKVVCADDGYMDPWNHDLHAVIYASQVLNCRNQNSWKIRTRRSSWSLDVSVLKFNINIWKEKGENRGWKWGKNCCISDFYICHIIK